MPVKTKKLLVLIDLKRPAVNRRGSWNSWERQHSSAVQLEEQQDQMSDMRLSCRDRIKKRPGKLNNQATCRPTHEAKHIGHQAGPLCFASANLLNSTHS